MSFVASRDPEAGRKTPVWLETLIICGIIGVFLFAAGAEGLVNANPLLSFLLILASSMLSAYMAIFRIPHPNSPEFAIISILLVLGLATRTGGPKATAINSYLILIPMLASLASHIYRKVLVR